MTDKMTDKLATHSHSTRYTAHTTTREEYIILNSFLYETLQLSRIKKITMSLL
ncbi:hypothetical protein ACJX0J_038765, partial [Zea mays]